MDRDNGSGLAVGAGLVLAYVGGAVLSVVVTSTVIRTAAPGVFIFGIVIAAVGQGLRLRSVRELGQSFTFKVHTATDQRVVSSGPYRLIRHPSYTGALVCAFGFSIAYTNWLAPLMVAFLALGYCVRIPAEERAMAAGLGQPYLDYMRRTKRLVPFVF
ncbi:methyltransferase family protein [Antrihabitans cavernicola]|uniref:methyltransferase family protein n=1 Tax=Antrihabitans cavernicola TaxID=2495913 RepID=UPI001F3F4601|nr:isoprenylcysteine carboxylmethyltransferase family protein [Spelaeibacter cavernicola]